MRFRCQELHHGVVLRPFNGTAKKKIGKRFCRSTRQNRFFRFVDKYFLNFCFWLQISVTKYVTAARISFNKIPLLSC